MIESEAAEVLTRDPIERDIFNEWFLDLMSGQGSCLFRDVLRDSKEDLWRNWKIRKPVDMEKLKNEEV